MIYTLGHLCKDEGRFSPKGHKLLRNKNMQVSLQPPQQGQLNHSLLPERIAISSGKCNSKLECQSSWVASVI